MFQSMFLLLISIFPLFSSFYLLMFSTFILFEIPLISMFYMNMSISLLIDWTSMMFLFTVMFISAMILIFSMDYIPNSEHKQFSILLLSFVLSMSFLILSDNIIFILLGWDGLGLTSYILVVYYQNASSSASGSITIFSNRMGDILILLSIAFLLSSCSWNFCMNSFHPYFSIKDIYGMFIVFIMFMFICFETPCIFMDVENFIPSNPMVTPVHIQPEWYFLFAYTILRSISSKIGGVVALVMSVVILYFLPLFLKHSFRSTMFYPFLKVLFWYFVVNWMMLTWIGACEVDYPFMEMGMVFSFMYFFMYFMFWMLGEIQDLLN